MIAAIMCGGKGIRMNSVVEKPMMKLKGKALIEYVFDALAASGRFGRIVATVSPDTPKTKKFLAAKGVDIIETAGEGFSQDLSQLLLKLKPTMERVLVVPADIPLLNAEIIREILDLTSGSQKPAVSLAIEEKFVKRIGAKPSVVVGQYCHSGITLFDTITAGTGMLKETFVVMNRKEIAVNVNTKEELKLAEKLLVQRA